VREILVSKIFRALDPDPVKKGGTPRKEEGREGKYMTGNGRGGKRGEGQRGR
jgi:hypothetical protein